MAGISRIPNPLLAVLSFIIALFIGALLVPSTGHWAVVIALTVLFALLYACAVLRGWTAAAPLPVVGSRMLSELFLALTLLTAGLGVSWYCGLFISRAYSDLWGILISLCLFGALMLAISSSRNWQ